MSNSSERPKVRLYADFQNTDAQRRLRLNCNGTIRDIARTAIRLAEGLEIVVSDGDLEAAARVTFSTDEGMWVAEIDWDKITNVD